MTEFIDIILRSGRSAVELALFVLLPIMIVMLVLMRLLEARGWLDRLVSRIEPVLRPFGIPGLGIFAMIQILFVSFAAPVATLAMMDKGGTSERHIAATLAMILSMAQANVVLPMMALGLHAGWTIGLSLLCGIVGAAATYHLFSRHLDDADKLPQPQPEHPAADDAKGVLDVINQAGAEALKIATGSIPILVLALVFVNSLRSVGLIELLESLSAPLFQALGLPSSMLLLLFTKFIAGGTAMMGAAVDFLNEGLISALEFNAVAGFLIHPFDLVGIAILISAGPRVGRTLKPALYGAMIAIAFRTFAHLLAFA